MPLPADPAILAALEPLFAAAPPPPGLGDVDGRRAASDGFYAMVGSLVPPQRPVDVTRHDVLRPDGTQLELRLYRPAGSAAGPVVYYLHGGGLISGSLDLYEPLLVELANDAGVAIAAPEYRLAPEFPDPVPVEDCLAGLEWLAAHSAQLGIDPSRIGISGDSAGAGLAAGVCLMARDRGGPVIARQQLAQPMLDDRVAVVDQQITGLLTWTYEDNATGWGALLGDRFQAERDVSPYAVPARADDLSGLPPAQIDVGELDILRDSALEYARRLWAAGVSVELHVYPGVPHFFEHLAPAVEVSGRAKSERARFLRAL